MKICIIGNSHVAALKKGWDSAVDSELKRRFDITFFASRGKGLENLKIKSGSLVGATKRLKSHLAFTSGGKDSIVIKDYDVFLIHGLEVRAYFESNSFYSKACIREAIEDRYSTALGIRIAEKVFQVSQDARVYIGHCPLSAEQQSRLKRLKTSPESYKYGLALVNEIFFSSRKFELLEQPPSTVTKSGRNTRFEFSSGSERLAIGPNKVNEAHPEADKIHMNAAFGKIYLESFLHRIS